MEKCMMIEKDTKRLRNLAGNVGEWCTDFYAYPYPAEA